MTHQNPFYPTQAIAPTQPTPTMTNQEEFHQLYTDWLSQDMFKPDLFGFISPPLTASPVSENESSLPPSCDFISLFPDMIDTHLPPPQPVQIQPVKRRLAPLMPKTAIGPCPGPFNPPPVKRKGVEAGDEVAVKRQKNTDAARRSRMKKILKMEHLEDQVKELTFENSRLTTRVAVLESEKGTLSLKEQSLEDRIRVLESQLSEAHRALAIVRS
ncbi:hypothetical protein G6F57_005988 [Rhizopus arrhizus]|uniref:BZIP domain-containing protein n=1 Tax=Rhizopus oryzae TaxID=64495 RepID=A0A9P6XA40_RHIOR|nr:hypothetical protein G6F23_010168 [Rhizopus arrhizus]KAG1405043.1 hypothetical protein G6F58_010087 [Rhizopus delemar]KAG0763837.1 hypothetical protein G6F24_005702 [Rhizopus arrhizus]KAG0790408.1 hypothetical protein G6F21_005831 [Rhizopus arrhizus]KAG0796304.1 hypothetical protein G6F22_004935 [Rhizopus arrhizus]